MTITLTFEELRHYQKRCEEHMKVTLEANLIKSVMDSTNLPYELKPWFIREWERIGDAIKNNPLPKLIPDL